MLTPNKDLPVFGRFHEMKELTSPRRSTSISNRLCSDMDLTMNTNFLNSTATAFVSPKLVRSPALKGGNFMCSNCVLWNSLCMCIIIKTFFVKNSTYVGISIVDKRVNQTQLLAHTVRNLA
ncbi:unnamed protein product [Trichobilharzia regenti]|nr:unnamed protein product [Trichobilharzia regenti]